MPYKFFFLFYPLLLLQACTAYREPTEKLVSLNLVDREGLSETISNSDRLKKYESTDFLSSQPYQKVLRVYHRKGVSDVMAYVTCYHPNGQLKQYLEVMNGRALGIYREWYPNGKLKVQANVVGGEADVTPSAQKTWLFDGLAEAWNEEGDLEAEIPYQKGVLEGTSIYYHPSGTIWKTIPFVNNQIQGIYTVFLENGCVLSTANYAYGVQHGQAIRYWKEHQVAAEETFQEGLLVEGRYYDSSLSLVSEIHEGRGFRAIFGKTAIVELQEYQQGILEGEVRMLDSKGCIIKRYQIRKGLKNGEETEYYEKHAQSEKQLPKISVNWVEDNIQGLVRTWYDNGIQESQREMSHNIKNGLATAWYRDGSLMLIEEYDHNKLVRGEYYKKGEKIPVSLISSGKGVATLFDAQGNFLRKINYINGVPLD